MEAPNEKRGRPKRPPARSVDERERQVISLAVDLAEKQLADGTASSQVMVHFLRLGTVKAKLEIEKLRHETELLQAKTEALESAKRMEMLYEKAMTAFTTYQGKGGNPVDDEVADD